MESFVGQLVLHKYGGCNGELREGDWRGSRSNLRTNESPGIRYGFSCEKCQINIQVDVVKARINESVWRYIRGGEKEVFRHFIKNLDCHIHPGDSYENLFLAYSVMCS